MRKKTPDILQKLTRERQQVTTSPDHNDDISPKPHSDLTTNHHLNMSPDHNDDEYPGRYDNISTNNNNDITPNQHVGKSRGRKIQKERATFYFPKRLLKDLDKCWIKARELRGDRKITLSDILEISLQEFVDDFLKKKENSEFFKKLKIKK